MKADTAEIATAAPVPMAALTRGSSFLVRHDISKKKLTQRPIFYFWLFFNSLGIVAAAVMLASFFASVANDGTTIPAKVTTAPPYDPGPCGWEGCTLSPTLSKFATNSPSTPTKNPTKNPTSPTIGPSKNPTRLPTKRPTQVPTTSNPSRSPTKRPTRNPTPPTRNPTVTPSVSPTNYPTLVPTTPNPTVSPSLRPTFDPVTPNPTNPTSQPNSG